MNSLITMYDTAFNDQFPAGGQAYAAYLNGQVGSQPNYQYVVDTFPAAHHLAITLFASQDGDCLDIEEFAASPEDAAAWYTRQKARGVERPCLYASAAMMQAQVIPVILAAGFPRKEVRLWSAHFGAGEHICAPATCGLMSIEADGTQWTDAAMGKTLDQSILQPDFFAPLTPPRPPKPPADWTFGPPRNLKATGGHTTVSLTWDGPAGAPETPAGNLVWIYAGPVCDRQTLVPSYPRHATASPWEGGGLQRGHQYTAHVAAHGPEDAQGHLTRLRPDTFASVVFATG